jgi:hypothetical protein
MAATWHSGAGLFGNQKSKVGSRLQCSSFPSSILGLALPEALSLAVLALYGVSQYLYLRYLSGQHMSDHDA